MGQPTEPASGAADTLPNEDNSGSERLKALTDGIFAVVMTLLVLEIKLPSEESSRVADADLFTTILNGDNNAIVSKIFFYAVTFLIAGLYWYNHMQIMRRMKRIDQAIFWLTMPFLLFITLLPFTSSLFNDIKPPYGVNTVLIYSGNNLIIGLWLILIWLYASNNKRLINDEVKAYEKPIIMGNIAVMPTTALFSIIFALLGLVQLGIAMYYIVPPLMSTLVGFAGGHARRINEGK